MGKGILLKINWEFEKLVFFLIFSVSDILLKDRQQSMMAVFVFSRDFQSF